MGLGSGWPMAGAGWAGRLGWAGGAGAGVLRLEPDFLKLGFAAGTGLNLVFVTGAWFWVGLVLKLTV